MNIEGIIIGVKLGLVISKLIKNIDNSIGGYGSFRTLK